MTKPAQIILAVVCLIIAMLPSALFVKSRGLGPQLRTSQALARVRSLVGHSRADAEAQMKRDGLKLRMTAHSEKEIHKLFDHVSPSSKIRPRGEVLKYTDQSMLTRSCVVIYLDNSQNVSAVHVATEYW